jgi:hypothetical protein
MTAALPEIIERVEAVAEGSRDLEWKIAQAIGHPSFDIPSTIWPPFMAGSKADRSIPAYTSSLDAALTLVPEGCDWQVNGHGSAWIFGSRHAGADGNSPALALCAAALRARLATQEQKL